MNFRITIGNATSRGGGIWEALAKPEDLLKLGNPARTGGQRSVVFVSGETYEAQTKELSFNFNQAELINLGITTMTLFISSNPTATQEDAQQTTIVQKGAPQASIAELAKPGNSLNGDNRYLRELASLPHQQGELGRALLRKIRQEFPGVLKYHPVSKKFVETPDNFWVVKVQPRAGSLRITVFGNPNDHDSKKAIDLRPDMNGYSAFTIDSSNQLEEAVSAIRHAHQLKNRGGRGFSADY